MAKYYQFHHYFCDDMLKKQLIAKRKIVVESGLYSAEPKWLVQGNGVPVEKNQNIAITYPTLTKRMGITVPAPCSGMFFHFRQKNVHYGVIANSGDNLDSIKAWVKQERG